MNGTPAREFDWRDGQMLVMGNEGAGASEAFKALGERITLPGDASKMESLNVAVSGATLLYEYALSVKP
jgi:tRNA G18 (ribose-2'-O)-methylase SpoU